QLTWLVNSTSANLVQIGHGYRRAFADAASAKVPCREAVKVQSPESRSALWVNKPQQPFAPRSGATCVAPFQGAIGLFCSVTQGALRDPGLRSVTPSAWDDGPRPGAEVSAG